MEYISQGHLRNYLKVERSESEAKVITRQLLEALVIIHQYGFAHRDLKPEVSSHFFILSQTPS
jgi:serine/threonine protein kinase